MAWSARRVRFEQVALIAEQLDLPEPMAWALVRRGLGDPEQARAFLAADGDLAPPEATPGIAPAADRLARAVRRDEEIVVHGDYDCDGIVSTAILLRALRARGGRASAFLPSRFSDGYGVSVATVERLADEGCRVLVCVDCGTTAVEALARAVELGIEPIVCDHHLAGGQRPPAILANPALGRGTEALPAAAGVVHRLVRALATRLDGDGLAPVDDGIDLVALATVADAVPLLDENRCLVVRGLRALRERPRVGIAALCAAAGLDARGLSARALGYQLAPAINASGRMAHPDRALELLLADERSSADPLAAELWQLNLDRREVEQRITDEAVAQIRAEPPERRDVDALVVAGDGWHEGVVGIVASRLVERFERPAIVIARDGELAKGSGRSLPGVDLHALVSRCARRLDRWGGHAGAIGLQIPSAEIGAFRSELEEVAAGSRAAIARARVRRVDAVVAGPDLTLAAAEALEALAPYGQGNPPLRLAVPGALLDAVEPVGAGDHVRVALRSGGARARAIGFRWRDRAARLRTGARYEAVVGLEVERWQGLVAPRVLLEALDPVPDDGEPWPLARPALEALVDGGLEEPDDEPPLPGAPPRAVRDRRGRGAALAALAALAGADRGAVAVVASVRQRVAAIEAALSPRRLGVDVAAIEGPGNDPEALGARLAQAEAGLFVVDYAALGSTRVPDDMHVVLVDPPGDARDAAWARARAADRWLHLVWGREEIDFAAHCAAAEWELRPVATALWRALETPCATAGSLVERLEADECVVAPVRAVARALAALAELELVALGPGAPRRADAVARRDLAGAPRYVACRRRLEAAREFLARAETLDLATARERAGALAPAHA